MKTVNFPMQLDEATFQRLELEAKRRHESLADVCRHLIAMGLPLLPLPPDAAMDSVVADTWEKFGPAPDIDYDSIKNYSTPRAISC